MFSAQVSEKNLPSGFPNLFLAQCRYYAPKTDMRLKMQTTWCILDAFGDIICKYTATPALLRDRPTDQVISNGATDCDAQTNNASKVPKAENQFLIWTSR